MEVIMHEYLLLSHSRQGISSAHQLWTYLHFLTSVVVVWLRLQPASTMKAYDYTEVVLEHRSSGKYIIFFSRIHVAFFALFLQLYIF